MKKSKRPVRRSQLISPWGVGAIIPFPNDESLMIAGLDLWRYPNNKSGFIIKDERLQMRLGIKELRWPPDFRDQSTDSANSNLTIPAVRFPTWHYCPNCGQMLKSTYFSPIPRCERIQWEKGRKCPPNRSQKRMIPERFVVVCPDGHINDFPISEWVHQDGDHTYIPGTCKIRRSTGGVSASLASITYECTCGAKRNLGSVMQPGALSTIHYRCNGAKPWLGMDHDPQHPCGKIDDVRVLLRGASNVWFADTRSSISIPTTDSDTDRSLVHVLEKYIDVVKTNKMGGSLNKEFIKGIAVTNGCDPNDLYLAFKKKINNLEALPEVTPGISEEAYRMAEYNVLIKSSGNDKLDFHSVNLPITSYNEILRPYFKSISLVPKLRETRAFIGFSRVEPTPMCIEDRKKINWRWEDDNDWLPAIEVYGEGIFFEFDKSSIEKWKIKDGVINRIAKLNRSLNNSYYGRFNQGNLKPEFVLIHTFAHLLINQLSFTCGYGSSSIRERIYCGITDTTQGMYGVLLYTASGDSEGSLGGLVRLGKPGRIEDMILLALKNAQWCSSDPICIQSSGQGPESANLAACHNCALLPETSCEQGNRLLDRGVVIGTLENNEIGFFSELREW